MTDFDDNHNGSTLAVDLSIDCTMAGKRLSDVQIEFGGDKIPMTEEYTSVRLSGKVYFKDTGRQVQVQGKRFRHAEVRVKPCQDSKALSGANYLVTNIIDDRTLDARIAFQVDPCFFIKILCLSKDEILRLEFDNPLSHDSSFDALAIVDTYCFRVVSKREKSSIHRMINGLKFRNFSNGIAC